MKNYVNLNALLDWNKDQTNNTDVTGKDAVLDPMYVKGLEANSQPESNPFDNSLFGNKYKMGNITGLASTFMQAAALPSMMKSAKLANQTAQFNLDTGREEQARRNKNISGFNAVRTPQSTQSAFV